MNRDRKVAIWGAGKIGRGFVAELFQRAGYELILVDTDSALINRLRAEAQYRIIKTHPDGSGEIEKVTRYRSFLASDPVLVEEFSAISLLAVCVPGSAFAAAARGIAAGLQLRAASAPDDPLDILLTGNLRRPAATFKKYLDDFLSDRTRTYVHNKVGFVDTVVIRMFEPSVDLTRREPLTIVTNGFPFMPVDKLAFKGPPPTDVDGLLLTETINAEQARKHATCETLQALLGHIGQSHGHWYAHEALGDPAIHRIVSGALREASQALILEYTFTEEEMDEWVAQVLLDAGNPFVRYRTAQLATHPIKDVSRDGPLTGTALMCRGRGVIPKNLATGMAHAFLSADSGAPQAAEIQQCIAQKGVEAAVRQFCGLDEEPELVDLVTTIYKEVSLQERK